jgi:hypothetical protein
MRQRQHGVQRSHQIQHLEHEQQQRRLAQHLHDGEAERIRAGNPCRSIRLHFRFDRWIRYFIFGEEGYVNRNDLWDSEFSAYGWRIDHSHLLRNQEEQEGNNASKQGAEGNDAKKQGTEQQYEPEGADAPADKETEGSISIQALEGNNVQGDAKHANGDAEGATRAACVSPSTLRTDSALTHDINKTKNVQ